MKKTAAVIISGGMDSTTLLYDIVSQGYEVYALSFNYNQRHVRELECAEASCLKLGVPHKVIDITQIGKELLQGSSLTTDSIETPHGYYQSENMKITVVPFRNQLFLTLACAYAESIKVSKVFYGSHGGDHFIYWDCRPSFREKFQEILNLNDLWSIELVAPYLNITKADIVKRGLELKVDFSKTWTCYDPQFKPYAVTKEDFAKDSSELKIRPGVVLHKVCGCGYCGSCSERIESFKVNGIIDPVPYAIEIDWTGCKK
jgi:7-cyano-7-deazaguanine synthase